MLGVAHAGLAPGMLDMNTTLLEMPADLHVGFMSQSSHDVMAVLQEAMHTS